MSLLDLFEPPPDTEPLPPASTPASLPPSEFPPSPPTAKTGLSRKTAENLPPSPPRDTDDVAILMSPLVQDDQVDSPPPPERTFASQLPIHARTEGYLASCARIVASHIVSPLLKSFLITFGVVQVGIGLSVLVASETTLTFRTCFTLIMNSFLCASPVFTLINFNEFPGSYGSPDPFVLPFVMSIANLISEKVSADPNCSEAHFLPTFLLAWATLSLLMSLLMFSMTAKAVPRSVRKLLNFGQFIPYPVLAGMMVSVGIYLIKMAMFLITSSANPNDIPVTALLHSKPELLPVVGVALVPPAILYLLTLLPNQDSLVPKNGLLIVMAATAIVPNILAFAGILSRDASFLFLPTSLMAPSPSAVSVSPLYNLSTIRPSTICTSAYTRALPSVLSSAVVILMRISVQIPAFMKTLSISTAAYEPPSRGTKKTSFQASPLVLRAYSLTFFVQPFVSSVFYVTQNAASIGTFCKYDCMNLAPYFFHLATIALVRVLHIESVIMVPTICLSTFSFYLAGGIFNIWLVRPFNLLTRTEFSFVLLFAILSEIVGVLPSVGIVSSICSLFFVGSVTRSGVIKFIGTGVALRSSVDRQTSEVSLLNENCDKLQIVCLQSHLFFGNAMEIQGYVDTMFKDANDTSPDLPPLPSVLVMDLNLVIGVDLAAAGVFQEIVEMCRLNNCKVIFSGLASEVRRLFEKTCGEMDVASDLDVALAMAEDELLRMEGSVLLQQAQSDERQRRHDSFAEGEEDDRKRDGFMHALKEVRGIYNLPVAVEETLKSLAPLVRPVNLLPGESLYDELANKLGLVVGNNEMETRGLFFIEHGQVRVEKDPDASTSHAASLKRRMNNLLNESSLTRINARTRRLGRVQEGMKRLMKKGGLKAGTTFRLATRGAGNIIGTREVATGMKAAGNYYAVTESRLFFLPLGEIQKLEARDPKVALAISQTVSNALASALDLSYERTNQYFEVLTSKDVVKPKSRKVMARVNAALERMDM